MRSYPLRALAGASLEGAMLRTMIGMTVLGAAGFFALRRRSRSSSPPDLKSSFDVPRPRVHGDELFNEGADLRRALRGLRNIRRYNGTPSEYRRPLTFA